TAFEPLPMLAEEAEAVVLLRRDVATAEAEVIVAVILDRPEVEDAGRWADEAEDFVAVPLVIGAVAKAAVAEIVGADVPFGPLGGVFHAEEFVGVPVDHRLSAEDVVVA